MQAIGVVLISLGLWIAYCAAYGVPPISTFAAILRDPNEFRQIIADSKENGREKYAALLSAFGTVAGVGSAATGINPYSNYKVSDDWEEHKARGSAGGIDYEMPVGTPLPTPFGGVVTNRPNNGANGNQTDIKLDNGYTISFLHLSEFKKQNGERVAAGSVIGLSGGAKGAPGAGSSTGPHVHIHMLDRNGTRVNFLDYIGTGRV